MTATTSQNAAVVPDGSVPVLSAVNVVKEFKVAGGHITAVDNVSVDFHAGKVLAVVGESGSGKSTLARMLLRLMPVTSGSIKYLGRDVTHIKGNELRTYWRDVQAVFQDPFSSFNQFYTVGQTLRRRMSAKQGDETLDELIERCLSYVGLKSNDAVNKYPHQLSGGQRQRVMIARALMMNPKVLLADEATSMLDASLRVSALNVLQDLRSRLGLTVLFITHDIGQACYLADEVVVMENGLIVEQGITDDVIFNPQNAYTKRLLADVPDLKGSLKKRND
jgi:peptide/nickel transport system ATP-binding protein